MKKQNMKERPLMSADDHSALFKGVWLIFFVGDSVYNIFGDINVMRNRNVFHNSVFCSVFEAVWSGLQKSG